ncbi:TlyA family RNA methyltransferase [uncultured Alsobacter sp.]|uniref:TlyA family RNA methyltransferase n=1 Tax=uncultured Alsobacter sp. TaxID=1748258 RepID=UPI0025F68CD5|nr:TlyA family RNA methyltransferase [uncultured Alsobacter sp.]
MTARRRADVALVEDGHFESRARAQDAIAAGLVRVNGKALRKASEPIPPGATIEAEKPHPWVSRGGVKLAAALDRFGIDPDGRACLDIGASTGGFTQVLLERGAARVVAVDVGRGQLHPALHGHPRLLSLEETDARALTAETIGTVPSLVTFDVSFIGLAAVLPSVLALAAPDATLVALVKPQFEAGREHVKKGIVRDPQMHAAVCQAAADAVGALGWTVLGTIPSPIEGGDGNREFLLVATRGQAQDKGGAA